MHEIALHQRALDSLHALRVEPFLKLISINPPKFDPRTKAFTYVHSAISVISQLMLAGHVGLAVSMRDHMARSVSMAYTGNRVCLSVNVVMPDGSEGHVSPASVAPGLDVALVGLYLRDITDSLLAADRYLNGMVKLVYCAPELLLNATKDGVTYRVRTDTPPVDAHLIAALDRALSLTGVQIVAFRIIRSDPTGHKRESIEPAQVVKRTQPLRPLATQALSRFLSAQVSPGISMR